MTRPSFALFACLLLSFYIPSSLSVPYINEQRDPAPSGPQVKTNGATFIGNTDDNYGVSTWLGIRYAQAPIGPLRLQPPLKVDNDGTINAKSFGPQCFQLPAPSNAEVSEDCLYLNIYKPSKAALEAHGHHEDDDEGSDSLPVMFWIHGGGFNDGSGQIYDSRSLVNTSVGLNTPVIVVTINYRLSFFGFSAGTTAIANNALNLGLLDQRMALQWIRDNIQAFGGDRDKVTIFGQSAGATSIGLQITAYDGKHEDLFRAAILESGSPQDTAPTPPATWPPYQAAWDAVIAGIGCNTSANVFSCVQNTPEALLFQVVTLVGTTLAPLPSSTDPWQPVIDGTFLTDFPTKLLAAGKFVKVPIIIGFTTDEVTYVIPTNLNISSDTVLAGLAEFVLPFVPLPVIEELLVLDPLSEYPNHYNVGGTEWKRATEIASDLFERCPGRAFVRNMSNFQDAWRYRWNAALPAQIASAPEEGIVHAADIPYVFGPSITPYINAPLDIALSLVVQKALISFAAHLNPNLLGDLDGADWPRYHLKSEKVFVFQKRDGSGEFPNGTFGVPIGQGCHLEKDPDDRAMCDYIIANDAVFVH